MNKHKDFAKSSVFHRINFLYQAAHTVLRLNPDNVKLVQFYINCLQSIARKNVLKIDPSIKRTLCKKCCLLLVPGITATVRIRANRQRSVVVTCVHCKTVKRFPVGQGHSKWNEAPQVTESASGVNATETATTETATTEMANTETATTETATTETATTETATTETATTETATTETATTETATVDENKALDSQSSSCGIKM